MAMIVHSASSPSTTSVPPPDPSSRPRLLSASVHSLNYIPIGEDSPAVQRETVEGSLRAVVPSKPKCCRKLIHRFEKEARKHELASATSHTAKLTRRPANVSVFERLADQRPSRPLPHDRNLTFSPKLNPLSIRLAQERSEKLEEIQTKATISAAAKESKIYANCTFKPVMSEKSLQLAQNIEAGFLTRQQLHLKKKQKYVS